ncbi:cytochrome P450 [Actinoallomurus rhizosphaericola]|uniref:cytochrome P450 n=1 Tax=Actinoallomurus rhizosphaericola TaxID=2952536 RepID=UPI00209261CF|nr:cytochrome P450 [Actinoallomurus rhizosphaericola]MCO5995880.1 cytochrome P450 [Actinoallomurus rhizosphaericola]
MTNTSPAGVKPAAADVEALDLDAVDLSDVTTFRDIDLVALWRRFRDERPVRFQPPRGDRPGFWAVSRYADVIAVYRDHRSFTTERGNLLTTLLTGGDSASGKMLAVTDGQRHREVRQLMLKAFSPRVLGHVAERIKVRIRRLVAEAMERGEFDYAVDVAEQIPIGTICDLLDIPEGDRQELLGLSKSVLSSDTAAPDQTEMVLARNEMLLYFTDLAAERREHPGEDVVSTLATSFLTHEEVVYNCYSLIIGGDESSRLSSTGAIHAFAGHPEQWAALKNGDVSAESAVEEILRWTTPAMHFGRTARVDVEVGGTLIPAGDAVTVWNTSANYDERVFPEPERFDLARTPNKHLTFGHGTHFCMGAFLGREQLRAMVETVRETVGVIELLGEPQQVYSNFMYGYCRLPVAFR